MENTSVFTMQCHSAQEELHPVFPRKIDGTRRYLSETSQIQKDKQPYVLSHM
jgi:hypothetical protein